MTPETPRLANVTSAEKPFTLKLTWQDGRCQNADLTGLVNRSPHFRIFLKDPEAFRSVKVINWGHGVEWENGLDYSADNLFKIAAEQEPWTCKQFRRWQENMKLKNSEAAAVLGYGQGQIKNFRSGRATIPVTVSSACRSMEADRTVFFAHFTPGRPPGRPTSKKPAVRKEPS